MQQEILFYLPDEFADWEGAFLMPAITQGIRLGPTNTGCSAKTITNEGTAKSIGGLSVVSDYTLSNPPDNFSALILIGGYSWFNKDKHNLLPLIDTVVTENLVLAAICNATVFLAINGYLNHVKHTSNGLASILQHDTDHNYSGQENFLAQDSVADKNIITANGLGSIEFTRDVIKTLNLDSEDNIAQYYSYMKNGFYS